MPVIRVEMFEGRTKAEKSALVEAITQAMVETCDAKPESVHIIIDDKKKENWGFKGKLCSDL